MRTLRQKFFFLTNEICSGLFIFNITVYNTIFTLKHKLNYVLKCYEVMELVHNMRVLQHLESQ